MATKTHPATCKIQYDLDGTPPFTDLAELIAISPPKLTKGDSQITTLASANQTREYAAGWRESGEATFKAYMTKAQFTTLLGFYNSNTTYYWRVLFALIDAEANNSIVAFQGYVKGVDFDEFSMSSDDPIQVQFTIKVTGQVTFTAGT